MILSLFGIGFILLGVAVIAFAIFERFRPWFTYLRRRMVMTSAYRRAFVSGEPRAIADFSTVMPLLSELSSRRMNSTSGTGLSISAALNLSRDG